MVEVVKWWRLLEFVDEVLMEVGKSYGGRRLNWYGFVKLWFWIKVKMLLLVVLCEEDGWYVRVEVKEWFMECIIIVKVEMKKCREVLKCGL